MAIHINEFQIDGFRGIQGFNVNNLNHINIIVGNNNSGKTSILEALLLLRDPTDFTDTLRLARMRDTYGPFTNSTIYENFINLFSKNDKTKEILLTARHGGRHIKYNLSGKEERIMMDPEDILDSIRPRSSYNQLRLLNSDITEADSFTGTLKYKTFEASGKVNIDINTFTKTSGRKINQKGAINIIYHSPTDHVNKNVFGAILRNDKYKDICLHILQIFDPKIIDLLILRNELNNRPVEYIKHATLGNMPLSTYGDGIKKVLSLANAIARASKGILLIDEIETSIHAKYYDDILKFLIMASEEFNVQLFLTTHSIETIDGLLKTQDYETTNTKDNISVLTIKKEGNDPTVYTRILSGRKVHSNREQFGFEVRL